MRGEGLGRAAAGRGREAQHARARRADGKGVGGPAAPFLVVHTALWSGLAPVFASQASRFKAACACPPPHPLKLHLAFQPLVAQHLLRLLELAIADQGHHLAAQRVLVAGRELEDCGGAGAGVGGRGGGAGGRPATRIRGAIGVFERSGGRRGRLLMWRAAWRTRPAGQQPHIAAAPWACAPLALRDAKPTRAPVTSGAELTLLDDLQGLGVLAMLCKLIQLVKERAKLGLLISGHPGAVAGPTRDACPMQRL